MTARGSVAMLVAFAAGVGALALLPDLLISVIIAILLPTLLIAAIAGDLYLARIYRLQPEPRSRFFRMLVVASTGKLVLGAWLVYLVVGRVGERTGWFEVSAPPTEISGPISAVLIALVFSLPIAYAVEIYRIRRRAGSEGQMDQP